VRSNAIAAKGASKRVMKKRRMLLAPIIEGGSIAVAKKIEN